MAQNELAVSWQLWRGGLASCTVTSYAGQKLPTNYPKVTV